MRGADSTLPCQVVGSKESKCLESKGYLIKSRGSVKAFPVGCTPTGVNEIMDMNTNAIYKVDEFRRLSSEST